MMRIKSPYKQKERKDSCRDETSQAGFGTGLVGSSLADAAKPARLVSLADHTAKPVKPVSLVSEATDESPDDSAPVVDDVVATDSESFT